MTTTTTTASPIIQSSCLRVNKGTLPQFIGKTVILPGTVINMNGENATIETVDSGHVTVILNQNINPSSVLNTFMEVKGTAEPDGSVRMIDYCSWTGSIPDIDLVNQMIRLQFPYLHLFD